VHPGYLAGDRGCGADGGVQAHALVSAPALPPPCPPCRSFCSPFPQQEHAVSTRMRRRPRRRLRRRLRRGVRPEGGLEAVLRAGSGAARVRAAGPEQRRLLPAPGGRRLQALAALAAVEPKEAAERASRRGQHRRRGACGLRRW
jgi:hypothetical protein